MASRAFATPWEMRLSPPVTSWLGEIVLVIDFLILAASMPVITFIKANAFIFEYEFDRYFNYLPITVMLDLPKAVSKNPSVETSHV